MVSSVNGAVSSTDGELDARDIVVETDYGNRRPRGITASLFLAVALLWSLFQLWVTSPLPYTEFAVNTLSIPVLNGTHTRFFHLAFALFLAFMIYPAMRRSPREYVPVTDWVLSCMAVVSIMYLFVFRNDLADRAGLPNNIDMAVSVVGVILLLEGARRTLGPPLVVIAVVFLFYSFAGHFAVVPDIIAHKGQSLEKVSSHQWLTTEGVFGVAIGVSTDFVFLFVLFGALLDKAGAGNYFIKVAFSMLGHLRGGPAKAAVLSSAMTGLVSGSSIANVVTTGTFTVPLMRKVGFSREKAGAVEVASSVNGQIMPPVMGAAAFLMAEYVGISYFEVVKHAFVPAVISYMALFYLVHLEAVKADMPVLEKLNKNPLSRSIINMVVIFSSLVIVSWLVYYSIGWVKDVVGSNAKYIIALAILLVYLQCLRIAAKLPPLSVEGSGADMIELPQTAPTVKTGLHFLLPIVVLAWCLMVERLSPGLSAFWATISMMFIVVTQRPILAFFRKEQMSTVVEQSKKSAGDLFEGLIAGARNMIGIGIATAAAGIIVGSVSLTGVGQVMTELVEILSGGSFFLVLVFTALICLILGMGLPTTANYIVVATLMSEVIVELGRQNGVIVPLIAVHLFVFYFGIMADVTPPVGLASFAAAAVSGGKPIKTGVQAFVYSLRTVILPFIFIYNTELLLVGVDDWFTAGFVFVKSTFAILLFAAAMQGYLITKCKIYEVFLLLLVAFAMFRPDFFVNKVTPKYQKLDAYAIEESLSELEPGQTLKINVVGEDMFGKEKEFVAMLDVEEDQDGTEILWQYGLVIEKIEGVVSVADLIFNSKAELDGFSFGSVISSIEKPQPQISRSWVYFAALALFFIVYASQRSRSRQLIAL